MIVNRKKQTLLILGILAGLALIITGFLLLRDSTLSRPASVCLSLGFVLFTLSTGAVIQYRIDLKHPEIKRARNINENDERFTLIRGQAATKTNIVFMWLLFTVMVIFTALGAELYVILTLSGLFLVNGIITLVFTNYYAKRL